MDPVVSVRSQSINSQPVAIDSAAITEKVILSARDPNTEFPVLHGINTPLSDAEVAAIFSLQRQNLGDSVVKELFPNIDRINSFEIAQNLYEAIKTVGAITYSFPLWRMTAVSLKNTTGEAMPSFFEQREMEKVRRISDKWIVPGSEKVNEDWLGSGFNNKKETFHFDRHTRSLLAELKIDPSAVYIEYRRSYVMISVDGVGTLMVRNSSYYFGRDNFKRAAYFTPLSLTADEIERFSPEMVDGAVPRMEPLFNSAQAWAQKNSQSLVTLTKIFQSANRSFFDFGREGNDKPAFDMRADNFKYLLDHLSERLTTRNQSAPDPILSVFKANTPPWSPKFSICVSPEILDELSVARAGGKNFSPVVEAFLKEASKPDVTIGLVSSVDGDLPFKGQDTSVRDGNNTQLEEFIKIKVRRDLEELGVVDTSAWDETTLFPNLRKIDFAKTVDSIVTWLSAQIKDAPGIVVSLSGTDSMLTFVLCSKALKALGRDPNRELIGIHFRSNRNENYPYAWLSQHGSVQAMEPPLSTPQDADIKRWSAIQSFAINNGRLWMIGSRNATEAHTADYSIASNCCSIFPIINLFKTEVLNICHTLGVPIKEINRSLAPDPECNGACIFQNRRVVAIDCLALNDLKLLPAAITLTPSSHIKLVYDQRIAQGRFRVDYHHMAK